MIVSSFGPARAGAAASVIAAASPKPKRLICDVSDGMTEVSLLLL